MLMLSFELACHWMHTERTVPLVDRLANVVTHGVGNLYFPFKQLLRSLLSNT